MTERIIPNESWSDFFYYLNQHFKDSIVKIEIVDDEDYRIDYAEGIPIKEFNLEEKDDGSNVVYLTAGSGSSFEHQLDFTDNITVIERDDNDSEIISSMETIRMNPIVKEAVLVKNPKLIKISSTLGRTALIRFHPLDEEDSAL